MTECIVLHMPLLMEELDYHYNGCWFALKMELGNFLEAMKYKIKGGSMTLSVQEKKT